MFPGGREPAKYELARAEFGNVFDLAAVSNYIIRAGEGANLLTGTRPGNAPEKSKITSATGASGHWSSAPPPGG